jgi:cytochrome bd ubiquinol oxidase subunit II
MSAFYLPLLLMLAGLILRGVAFEFRNKTQRMRWVWDAGFAGGSLVAATRTVRSILSSPQK